MWISPEFKIYLVREFRRLKNDWETSSFQYFSFSPIPASAVYASGADLLNVALFSQTAKQWRDANPAASFLITDHSALLFLTNLESLNSVLIRQGLPQPESLAKSTESSKHPSMTAKRFYDWQTAGGTDDVMRLVNCPERADIVWCAIGGVAVNHWVEEPMVTQDVDFVVATDSIPKAVELLEAEGFASSTFECSVNFKGSSKVSMQLSTEDFYRDFAARSVPADVHGILLRVASLHDTLAGKIKAWSAAERRQSKRIKHLGDISRLVESHPELWDGLPPKLQTQIEKPA